MEVKRAFLASELWILAWGASVQHVRTYRDGIQAARKVKFRDEVISFIRRELLPRYTRQVKEHSHCDNIDLLIKHATGVGKDVLCLSGYRYAVAQKLLNLGLKYYWCLGEVAEPPHCPVDSIILAATRLKNSVQWTKIETKDHYLEAIKAIREKAISSNKSIAQWELENYRRR